MSIHEYLKSDSFLHHFFLVLCAATIYLSFNFHVHGKGQLIWADAEGYYMYLPATFIYDGFKKLPIRDDKQFHRNDEGRVEIKYTYGVALLESPFFLIAHTIALNSSFKADGHSDVYQTAMMFAGASYGLLGLFIMSRILRRKNFSVIVIILTILGIYGGTNLYYYTVGEPGMSHVYSFFLFALFLFFNLKFLNSPKLLYALLIVITLGVIVLIRPVNIIVSLLLFFDLTSVKEIKERLLYYLRHWWKFALGIPFLIALFLPQMFYWHLISGNYIYYSYEHEGFKYWNNPKMIQVLFDVRNGLFLYSPILLFSMTGIYIMSQWRYINGMLIGIIFLLATYIFSSWWAYWFGGAFGHRSFVEYYAVLIIPLAYTTHSLLATSKNWIKLTALSVYFFLIFYSVKMAYLYDPPWDGPEWGWDSYLEVLSKLL